MPPEPTSPTPSRSSTSSRAGCARECPWDREQDERSIVPHTVEEAYELADAANAGDDAKLLDELGDVLFQVHFLSLLLEERGAGDMAQVAEHVPPEAHPPPPARLRRRRGRQRRRGAAQLGRDQGDRARAARRASSARCPRTSRAAVRAQGAAPRGHQRLRLRPRPLRRGRGRARGARGRRRRPRRGLPRGRRRALRGGQRRAQAAASTPSSRCAPPPSASASASRRPRRSRAVGGRVD